MKDRHIKYYCVPPGQGLAGGVALGRWLGVVCGVGVVGRRGCSPYYERRTEYDAACRSIITHFVNRVHSGRVKFIAVRCSLNYNHLAYYSEGIDSPTRKSSRKYAMRTGLNGLFYWASLPHPHEPGNRYSRKSEHGADLL